jgi:hypothetical protein
MRLVCSNASPPICLSPYVGTRALAGARKDDHTSGRGSLLFELRAGDAALCYHHCNSAEATGLTKRFPAFIA